MALQLINNATIELPGGNPYDDNAVFSGNLKDYTINEKRQSDASLKTGGVNIDNPPKLRYFGVGIGGVKPSDRGLFVNSPKSTNADLFSPIPLLAIKKTDEEIIRNSGLDDDIEKVPGKPDNMGDKKFLNTFRMRVEKDDYAMFYLKEISGMSVDIIDVKAGESASEGTLAPELNPGSNTMGNTESTQQVAKVEGTVSLNHAMLRSVIDAFGYTDVDIFTDTTQADTALHISEIGIYSGVDVDTNTTANDAYTESGFCHLQFHKCWSGHSLNDNGPDWSTTVILENGSLALF